MIPKPKPTNGGGTTVTCPTCGGEGVVMRKSLNYRWWMTCYTCGGARVVRVADAKAKEGKRD